LLVLPSAAPALEVVRVVVDLVLADGGSSL